MPVRLLSLPVARCLDSFLATPHAFCHASFWAGRSPLRSLHPRHLHRTTCAAAPATQDHLHTYHVTARTGLHTSSADVQTSTGHSLRTDVPRAMGGKDLAPQPVETLLAALAGCTQATALFVGRQMKPRVRIDLLEMEFKAERDTRGAIALPISEDPSMPARLTRVEGRIVVHTREHLSKGQLNLLQHQTELRCPVASMMVASGCDMSGVLWVEGKAQ